MRQTKWFMFLRFPRALTPSLFTDYCYFYDRHFANNRRGIVKFFECIRNNSVLFSILKPLRFTALYNHTITIFCLQVKMRFLVSPFLLLAFLAINQFASATQQYLSPEGGDTFPATEQDNTRQTMLGHRMKRAFTTFSPFLKAWRAILKTTFAVSKNKYYTKTYRRPHF